MRALRFAFAARGRAVRLAFGALCALGLAAPGARAQAPVAAGGAGPTERVLRAWVAPVKLAGGAMVNWHHTVTYDAATGETVRTTRLADGTLVGRVAHRPLRPTPEEIEEARALILAHPEVAALTARAGSPVVDGGFILQREAGHPCGPGSRCLQFDVLDLDDPHRPARLRYVVVDLRAGRVLDADFQPARDGNRF
jgi:hypothetical protein